MSRYVTVLLMLIGLVTTVVAQESHVLPADLEPDAAVAWMTLAYRLVEAEKLSAPDAARVYVYAGVTLYEAVMPGMPDNRSLDGQLNGLNNLPYPEEDGAYDWLASLNTAIAKVLPALFENPSDATLAAIKALHDEQLAALDAEPDVLTRSIEYGDSLADAIIDWDASDHLAEIRTQPPYTPPAGAPELWVNIPADAAATEPSWGSMRPFILEYAEVCAIELNLIFSTDETSTLYRQAQEVVNISAGLTDEQAATAAYWFDAPGETGTSAGHWVSIMNQLPAQLNLKMDRTLEMYAMTTFVMADVYISTWSLKYNVLLLRPETYIQQHLQPGWTAPLAVPPYPDYPGEQPAVAIAAAETLTQLFGTVAFTDETRVIYGHGDASRTYTSFYSAAYEAADAALWSGTQFRVSVENGIEQGRCVVQSAFNEVRLNPIRQGE